MSPSLKAHSNYSTVTCVENGWVVHGVRPILFIYSFFHEKGSKVVERESPSLSNAEAPQCPVDFSPLLKVRMYGMCPITPPDLSIHDKSLLKRSAFRMKKKRILFCGATKKNGPVKNNWSGKCFQLHLSSSVKVPWKTEGKAIRFDHFSNLTIFLLNPLKELWMFSRMFQALQSSTIFNNAITSPTLFISSQYFWYGCRYYLGSHTVAVLIWSRLVVKRLI